MALDTILLGLFAFMLGGGTFGGKKAKPSPTPPGGGPSPAPSTPSKVPWPAEPGTVLPTGTDAGQVALAEKDLIIEKEKLKRDAAEARERAKGDPVAQADINRKEAERAEALRQMQADIDRAKGKA